MPTPAALITHGSIPADITLLDEPDMLVQSLTVTPSREEKTYKGANRAVQGIEYTNPTISFSFEAYISERTGLCDTHPGTAVTSLLNFAAARFGFDPTDGVMVYKDASAKQDLENPETISFVVQQFPFVA